MKEPRSRASDARFTVRELSPRDWPVLQALFGPNGACGGCWCMTWRIPGGKTWEANKGEKNKRAFKTLVTKGEVHGCLAFAKDEPVGWCCIGPKHDFQRLAKSRVLATESGERTWAVTCFYIPSRWRGAGVATALLRAAVSLARKRGARELEGYPVVQRGAAGAKIPAAFAWTGVPKLFERAGFEDATPRKDARPIYVKKYGVR